MKVVILLSLKTSYNCFIITEYGAKMCLVQLVATRVTSTIGESRLDRWTVELDN
jgi:hypothetical protein